MMPLDAESPLSDDALMILFANGDGAAAAALAQRHTSRVLALALRMLGDRAEAEDVAQEAMLRLWKIAPQWRQGEAKVSTWLYRVAANLCTDRLRLRRRRTAGLDEAPEEPDTAPSAEAVLIGRDRAQAVHRAIDALPERQRMAMTLRFLQEVPNPEVAEIMDTTVEAVESLLSRGKRAVAARLAGQREELGL